VTEHDLHRFISLSDRIAQAPRHTIGYDVAIRLPAADYSEWRLALSRIASWQAQRLNSELDALFDLGMAVSR
jgi:hypothetical protein